MKKLLLTIAAIGLTVSPLRALTVENTAGKLHELVTDVTARELVLTGTMNDDDFDFIAGKMTLLEVLDLSGATVSVVPDVAFLDAALQRVVLPEGLTEIGYGAFAGCKALSQVNFPSTLTAISAIAFKGTALTAITLPASVAHVGNGAFAQCLSLTTVALHSAYIGSEAFKGDTRLATLVIGAEAREIGAEAFLGTALTTIDLSDAAALTTVGDYAFAMTPLTTATLPAGVTHVGAGAFLCDNSLATAVMPALDTIPAFTYAMTQTLTADAVPDGVVAIGERAFYGVTTTVDELALPASLTSIGTEAFAGTTGVKQYEIAAQEVPALGDNVWNGVEQSTVKLGTTGNDVAALYREAAQWQDFHILWNYLMGDVNDDGKINVADYTLTIRHILNLPNTIFIVEAADYNGDNKINVADYSKIINAILTDERIHSRRARGGALAPMASAMLAVDAFDIACGETREVAMQLSGSTAAVAMQWLLTLPEGLHVQDCYVAQGAARHSVAWLTDDDGVTHMMLGSMRNEELATGSAPVVTLVLAADATYHDGGAVEVGEVLLADAVGTLYRGEGAVTRIGTVTAVNDIVADNCVVTGGVGEIIIQSPAEAVAQVVSVSGISRVVNVPAGTITVEVPAGVYIVQLGGVSHKLVVR